MEVSFGNKKVHLEVFKTLDEPLQEDEECFMLDVLDDLVNQSTLYILSKDSLERFLTFEASNEFDLDPTLDIIEKTFQATYNERPIFTKLEALQELRSTPLPNSLE